MCCYVVVVIIVSYINRSFEFRSWDAAGSDERRSYWSIVCLNLFLGFIYNSSVRELTNKSSRFSIKDEFWLMDLNKVVPCCYVRLISSSRFSVSLKISAIVFILYLSKNYDRSIYCYYYSNMEVLLSMLPLISSSFNRSPALSGSGPLKIDVNNLFYKSPVNKNKIHVQVCSFMF